MRKLEIPEKTVTHINEEVDRINAISDSKENLKKLLDRSQIKIVNRLENELKIVPKKHYRNIWIGLGVAVFGIPIGVAIGISLRNIGLLGIGLPLGLGIGYALGSSIDKKAYQEGRQLDLELK